jgi:outer membrane lipoprotein
MKKSFLLLLLLSFSLVLYSCAPVLSRSFLREGDREVSFNALRQYPAEYKGRLYIFGGVIIQTRLTAEGSRIEAMHVPVDRYGYFVERGQSEGRFLAIMPKSESMLDPEVFRKGRRITVAAEFLEVRKDRIDEMEYSYPVFLIRQIYLWPRERAYYPAYYYDPWFYPYPYYFWDPWWSYPYYYNYYYRGGPPPIYRRSHPPGQPPPSQSPAPTRRLEPAPEQIPGPGPVPDRGRERR